MDKKVVGKMEKEKESLPDGSASEFGSCLGLAPRSPAIGLFALFVYSVCPVCIDSRGTKKRKSSSRLPRLPP